MLAVLLLLMASCGNPPSRRPSPARSEATPAGRPPIVLLVLENHEYDAVVGSADAPYLNQTLIPSGRLFTDYRAVTHPSLPNYLAMTSGATQGKDGTDAITAGEIDADNIFHQLEVAGISWRVYQESMPETCFTGVIAGPSPGTYALKHDPAMAYRNIATMELCRKVVPYDSLNPSHLPAFSFLTPNQCNDMHSCPVSSGDAWLRTEIPPLLQAHARVLVTFDEGVGSSQTVMTLEVGRGVIPGTDDHRYDHYSLLAGLERHFGLAFLGEAADAQPLPV
jgi:phosphatidylinositol-3-phosphatase